MALQQQKQQLSKDFLHNPNEAEPSTDLTTQEMRYLMHSSDISEHKSYQDAHASITVLSDSPRIRTAFESLELIKQIKT